MTDIQGTNNVNENDYDMDDEAVTVENAIDEALADDAVQDAVDADDDEAERERERRWAERVRQANKWVAEAEDVWNAKKDEAKAAKDAYELRVAELRAIIDRTEQPTLYDGVDGDESADTPPANGEGWRHVDIHKLADHGLSESTCQLLHDAGYEQIGMLATWTEAGRRLSDIKGVGESKAEKISDALSSFWRSWGVV